MARVEDRSEGSSNPISSNEPGLHPAMQPRPQYQGGPLCYPTQGQMEVALAEFELEPSLLCPGAKNLNGAYDSNQGAWCITWECP
jgi:hypothetical protein